MCCAVAKEEERMKSVDIGAVAMHLCEKGSS